VSSLSVPPRADTPRAPRVLGELLGSAAAMRVLRVVGVAVAIGLCAQVVVPLPGTPVPFTLQTFAVLAGAAALGPFEGAAAVGLYLAAGAAGVPWFAGAGAGFGGPSAGYLLGMLLAAPVVGLLAARGADRHVAATVGLMALGSTLVYLVGASWLAASIHVDAATAIRLGVVPFLAGDAVKAAGAALLLPGAWRLLRRR
jgi:biotin transport system substrate-specific component